MADISGHWYDPATAEPRHFIEKKDGSGNRPTTLADARKNGWVPSVTQVLKILDKPGLRDWLIRQSVYAVVTAPDVPGENIDAKIERVLSVERQQDQESQIAKDRGTAIHEALECYFLGKDVAEEFRPWIDPAAKAIVSRGQLVSAEKILVGKGYAGKVDLIQEAPECWWIVDWKTTKTLPKKGAWSEHVLQLSAYAAAFWTLMERSGQASKPIRTSNVYISTVEQGQFAICDHDPDWQKAFNQGFQPLLTAWMFLNNYYPKQ